VANREALRGHPASMEAHVRPSWPIIALLAMKKVEGSSPFSRFNETL
jgi:hypothetical protein